MTKSQSLKVVYKITYCATRSVLDGDVNILNVGLVFHWGR